MREQNEKCFMQFQLDLQNCCAGCLVTVILRDTSAGTLVKNTPTSFLFSSLLVFPLSPYSQIYVQVLLQVKTCKISFFFFFFHFLNHMSHRLLTHRDHTDSHSCSRELTALQQGRKTTIEWGQTSWRNIFNSQQSRIESHGGGDVTYAALFLHWALSFLTSDTAAKC